MPFDRVELNQETLNAAIGNDWSPQQLDIAMELLAKGEGKIPSGTRKLPAELVRAIQRERLIRGMLKAASELSYLETNVQDVIDRAGVSRPTFYEHFANKEDCFLAAFDAGARWLLDTVGAATRDGGDGWRDQVRSALGAVLKFAGAEPDTARVLVVEARAASPEAVLRRVKLLEHFATCLDSQVRASLPDAQSFSTVTASGVIGGVEALLYSRLCKNEADDLDSLLPSLMYFVVTPYEGHEAASEELAVSAR